MSRSRSRVIFIATVCLSLFLLFLIPVRTRENLSALTSSSSTANIQKQSESRRPNHMSLQRFCSSSLSRSRIVLTGESASTIKFYNTGILELLTKEFGRPTAATEPPLIKSCSSPAPPTCPNELCKLRVAQSSKSSSNYVIVFVATKTEMENSADMRLGQLANLVSSGVCNVAVVIAPDLAGNRAVIDKLASISNDVEIIDVNPELQAENGGSAAPSSMEKKKTTGNGDAAENNMAAAAAAALDDYAGMHCTPRQFVDAASERLWSFVSKTGIASGGITVHCVGDSLTEGYTKRHGRLAFTPYADFLSGDVLPNRFNRRENVPAFAIPCFQYGVSGQTTDEIRGRFEELVSGTGEMNRGDICVFLGGTNDLGVGRGADAALADMTAMVTDAVQKVGMRVIICSIPSTAQNVKRNEFYLARERYNAELKALADKVGAEFVDFFEASSVETKDEESGTIVRKLRPELAADNLHCTPSGYRLLAECVGTAVRKFLLNEKQ